ncbi:uncharacterized protein LOC131948183 isoform X2 [Physella acuta]|nr:uncharacterized protein LOC131948183 isoform X2 [Physella acuta]
MASTLNLALLALDRCLSISYPFHYKNRDVRRRTAFIIIGVWACSLVYGLLPMAFNRYSPDQKCLLMVQAEVWYVRYLTTVLSFSGISLSIVCYCIIWWVFHDNYNTLRTSAHKHNRTFPYRRYPHFSRKRQIIFGLKNVNRLLIERMIPSEILKEQIVVSDSGINVDSDLPLTNSQDARVKDERRASRPCYHTSLPANLHQHGQPKTCMRTFCRRHEYFNLRQNSGVEDDKYLSPRCGFVFIHAPEVSQSLRPAVRSVTHPVLNASNKNTRTSSDPRHCGSSYRPVNNWVAYSCTSKCNVLVENPNLANSCNLCDLCSWPPVDCKQGHIRLEPCNVYHRPPGSKSRLHTRKSLTEPCLARTSCNIHYLPTHGNEEHSPATLKDRYDLCHFKEHCVLGLRQWRSMPIISTNKNDSDRSWPINYQPKKIIAYNYVSGSAPIYFKPTDQIQMETNSELSIQNSKETVRLNYSMPSLHFHFQPLATLCSADEIDSITTFRTHKQALTCRPLTKSRTLEDFGDKLSPMRAECRFYHSNIYEQALNPKNLADHLQRHSSRHSSLKIYLPNQQPKNSKSISSGSQRSVDEISREPRNSPPRIYTEPFVSRKLVEKNLSKSSTRLLKTIFLTQVVFIVCMLPGFFLCLLYGLVNMPNWVINWAPFIAFLNSGMNVFIYAGHNRKYRTAIFSVLHFRCAGQKHNNSP